MLTSSFDFLSMTSLEFLGNSEWVTYGFTDTFGGFSTLMKRVQNRHDPGHQYSTIAGVRPADLMFPSLL